MLLNKATLNSSPKSFLHLLHVGKGEEISCDPKTNGLLQECLQNNKGK